MKEKNSYRLMAFTANWCKCCREQKEKFIDWTPPVPLEVHDIDKPDSYKMTRKLSITDVPTTVLVRDDGQVIWKWVDVTEPKEIEDYINKLYN